MCKTVLEFGLISPRKPMYKPKPPDTKSLEAARKQRLKEIQMWSVIREILFYAFFLWILLVISYRNVSTDSYNYKHNMQKVFILTNDTNKAFSKVYITFSCNKHFSIYVSCLLMKCVFFILNQILRVIS